jgi:glycosyltransferase involved in cell wall biosynthesis
MPVLEAMACGTPVVTTDVSALPEVTGGAAFAMLPPDKPAMHIEALEGLFGDAQAAQAAVERGRARAAQYTWQRSTDLLAQALSELA